MIMAISSEHSQSPYQDQHPIYAGADLKDAKAAMVMVHGRGASGHDILTLAPDLKQPDFAYVAPQAYARVPLDIKNSCVARGFSPCLTAGSNEPIGA